MSIVISSALALSPAFQATANHPVIGWRNLVTTLNVAATSTDADHPVTNIANPSTNLRWQGELASPVVDEYITVEVDTVDDIDYVGVARHNFGTMQATISLEAENVSTSPVSWDEIVEEFIPATDAPLILRFEPQAVTKLRLRIQNANAAPYVAVLYAGKLLVLERTIYVGHTPITLGRSSNIVNAVAESGNFLGRIVLGEMTGTQVQLNNLTPAWVRSEFDPFVVASKENPFFFAWRPGDYPAEVGYAWCTDNPQPANALPNGMMSASFAMTGISK